MTTSSKILTNFHFHGELSKVSYEKRKLKYIKLATEQGEYWIKIPKKLRNQIAVLSPGCQLEVDGNAKQHLKKDQIIYKAQKVLVVIPDTSDTPTKAKHKTASLLPMFDGESNSRAKTKAKVLICNKSNCWKKGGNKVYAEIKSILKDHNLTQEIPIKQTGCLKHCKKAPALVMMPDKVLYNKVKPKQVAKMVNKHLIIDD